MVAFCNICNSRNFVDFRGRVGAQCAVCGSLERHRALGLFLMTLPTSRKKVCVVSRHSGRPKYIDYLTKLYGSFEFLVGDAFRREHRTFQIVIHDHLLHENSDFFGQNSYVALIDEIDGLLENDGLQVFMLGNTDELESYLGAREWNELKSRRAVFTPDNFRDAPLAGGIKIFDPIILFEKDAASQAHIGRSSDGALNGNAVLFCRKN